MRFASPLPCLIAVVALLPVTTFAAAPLIISELRASGPSGANDEFIEIYNNSAANVTVNAADGSAGFAVAASDGVTRFVIPNGTVIRARAHYLGVNSGANGYSLAAYPAGSGTTATGDATYTNGFADNAGVALFQTANAAHFTLANRLDAIGSASEPNALYREGAGYVPLTTFNLEGSLFRAAGNDGFPTDSDNNAADVRFADVAGTLNGGVQQLGAPSPQNLSSPIALGGHTLTPHSLLDATPHSCIGCIPNRYRIYAADPSGNGPGGSIFLRRTFTNTTGANITRLRFRIDRLEPRNSLTHPTLRALSADSQLLQFDDDSELVVHGTTLEAPPGQPSGGGVGSSLEARGISAANPLPPGASWPVVFHLGLRGMGSYILQISTEGEPAGGDVWLLYGQTEVLSDEDNVVNITPVAAGEAYNANAGTPLTVAAPGLLANDFDPDGGSLSAVLASPPAHGSVVIQPNGAFIYTPNDNHTVSDSFSYYATDGKAKSNPVTTTIGINLPPSQSFPGRPEYQTYGMPFDVGVPGLLSGAFDVNHDVLTVRLVAPPSQGTLQLHPNGSFSYSPAPAFVGTDSFRFVITDGQLEAAPQTAIIQVLPTVPALSESGLIALAILLAAAGVLRLSRT